jgi:hypothetical protein
VLARPRYEVCEVLLFAESIRRLRRRRRGRCPVGSLCTRFETGKRILFWECLIRFGKPEYDGLPKNRRPETPEIRRKGPGRGRKSHCTSSRASKSENLKSAYGSVTIQNTATFRRSASTSPRPTVAGISKWSRPFVARRGNSARIPTYANRSSAESDVGAVPTNTRSSVAIAAVGRRGGCYNEAPFRRSPTPARRAETTLCVPHPRRLSIVAMAGTVDRV